MGELISCANLAWRISEEGVGEWIAGIRIVLQMPAILLQRGSGALPIVGIHFPLWKSTFHRWLCDTTLRDSLGDCLSLFVFVFFLNLSLFFVEPISGSCVQGQF